MNPGELAAGDGQIPGRGRPPREEERVELVPEILDGHVHCYQRSQLSRLVADIQYTGARQFCALVTDRNDVGGEWQWANALQLKRSMPDRAFVFGGLNFQSTVPLAATMKAAVRAAIRLLTARTRSAAMATRPNPDSMGATRAAPGQWAVAASVNQRRQYHSGPCVPMKSR